MVHAHDSRNRSIASMVYCGPRRAWSTMANSTRGWLTDARFGILRQTYWPTHAVLSPNIATPKWLSDLTSHSLNGGVL